MSQFSANSGAGSDYFLNPLEQLLKQLQPSDAHSRLKRLKEQARHYKLVTTSLVVLIIGLIVIATMSVISSNQLSSALAAARHLPPISQPNKGPNRMVSNQQLSSVMSAITTQPIDISVGSNQINFSPTTISSWLQTVNDKGRGVTYLHVNQAKISSSVASAVSAYNISPVNQVSVTHGATSQIIVAGRNGSSIGSPASIIKQIGQTLLSGSGMKFNLSLNNLAFASWTPANFNKLIEVDVNLKQMYLYQNGQQIERYGVDAGAPQTPTPIGEFHILYKLPLQTMTGVNTDGTTYVQPNVQWINYFYSGDAIHGNYWVPAWHFGVINSSHGCVSVPNNEAEYIYNWAPIGTTVITHA